MLKLFSGLGDGQRCVTGRMNAPDSCPARLAENIWERNILLGSVLAVS
jgi:hypothetical protein